LEGASNSLFKGEKTQAFTSEEKENTVIQQKTGVVLMGTTCSQTEKKANKGDLGVRGRPNKG